MAEMMPDEAEVRRFIGDGHERFRADHIAAMREGFPKWPARSIARLLVDLYRDRPSLSDDEDQCPDRPIGPEAAAR